MADLFIRPAGLQSGVPPLRPAPAPAETPPTAPEPPDLYMNETLPLPFREPVDVPSPRALVSAKLSYEIELYIRNDPRGAGPVLAEPMMRDGNPVAVGNYGINVPVFAVDAKTGDTLVFKQEKIASVDPERARKNAGREIVASHIYHMLGAPTVLYREAVLQTRIPDSSVQRPADPVTGMQVVAEKPAVPVHPPLADGFDSDRTFVSLSVAPHSENPQATVDFRIGVQQMHWKGEEGGADYHLLVSIPHGQGNTNLSWGYGQTSHPVALHAAIYDGRNQTLLAARDGKWENVQGIEGVSFDEGGLRVRLDKAALRQQGWKDGDPIEAGCCSTREWMSGNSAVRDQIGPVQVHNSPNGVASVYTPLKTMARIRLEGGDLDCIHNPIEAVHGVIADAFVGTWDRTTNLGNLWVRPDGRILFGDYGDAFNRSGLIRIKGSRSHPEWVGLPKLQLDILSRFATKERVEPVYDKICSLSDPDLETLVDKLGRAYVSEWTPDQSKEMAEILKTRRDVLRQANIFRVYYDPSVTNQEIDTMVRTLQKMQPEWSAEAESNLTRHFHETRDRLRQGDLHQRRLTFTQPYYMSELEA